MTAFRFVGPARAELFDEIARYRAINVALALRFQQAIDQAIRAAAVHPLHGAPHGEDLRRRVVRGFPYAVVYRVEPTGILIAAIAHDRRRPDYWLGRLPTLP